MKKVVILASIIISCLSVSAQIVPNNTMTPDQLVQNYLAGPGVIVSNVVFNGAPGNLTDPQIGYFSGSSNIGIDSGVVISTGNIMMISGPNFSSSTSTSYGQINTDPDLNAISTVNVNDPGILEFDFVPTGDTVKFTYVFGSEEYMEWVFSGVNDAFGIFLSGPGISGPYMNGGVNMATIPVNIPVSIDNINLFANSTYYIDNPINGNSFNTQFDGNTVKLTAQWPVTCGQTYHIKFAIGDGGDWSYDSGVFLEAGSFSSSGSAVAVITPPITGAGPNAVFEGCLLGNTVDFTFTRPDVNVGDTVFFTVGGDAVNGTDYTLISPSYIVFPAGQDSVTLSVTVPDDGIIEGIDTLILSLPGSGPCSAGGGGVSLYIYDPYVPQAYAGNDTVYSCPGQTLIFNGIAMSGNAPYNFSWSDGTQGPTVNYTITQLGSDTIILNMTDGCGYFGADTLIMQQVTPAPLVADAGPDQVITCPGQTILLTGSYSGGFGSTSQSWSTGDTTANTAVQPLVTSQYIYTVSNLCQQTDSDTVIITVPPYTPLNLFLSHDTIEVNCPGTQVNVLGFVTSGGTAPYTYFWSNMDTDSVTTVTVNNNDYLLFVATDACGLDTAVVIPMIVLGGSVDLNFNDGRYCRNDDSTALVPLTISGGVAPYSFTWNPQPGNTNITVDTVSMSFTAYYPVDGIYNLTITDACGATDTDSAWINMMDCDLEIPNIFTPNGDGVNDYFEIDGLLSHPNSELWVYNRWGILEFYDPNYLNNWNGNGASPGVYFFVLELNDGTIPGQFTGYIHINY